MAIQYTVTRVELHHSVGSDYGKLHEKMVARGFYPFYEVGDRRYHLPEGVYIRYNGTPFGDLTLAQAAVSAAGKDAEIFVTAGGDAAQSGLRTERVALQ